VGIPSDLKSTLSSSSFEFFDFAQAEIASARLADRSALLVKPWTFMNNSGFSVRVLVERLRLTELHRLLIVHDDLDLDLGRIKLKQGGGSGGHNGLKSLIDELGSADFLRLRLGVGGWGRVPHDTVDFVLSPFAAGEQPLVVEVKLRGADGIVKVVGSGVTAAMNLINRRDPLET
jgi:PTH1 family peptidyl-tRNA hydrolase